jgi:hypothetical protein
MVREIKLIESHAAEKLHAARQLHLILGVGRCNACPDVIVGIGRTLTIRDWNRNRRVQKRHLNGRGVVVEESGVAEIVGPLPSELSAEEKRVPDSTRSGADDEIGLIEHVGALGGIVVGRQRDQRLIRQRGSRHVVLVEAVVTGRHRAIANGCTAPAMLNSRRSQVDSKIDVAVVGVSIKQRRIDGCGRSSKRGDTSIGGAAVV